MTSLRTTTGALSRTSGGRTRHVRRALGSGDLNQSSTVTIIDNTRHNAFGGGYLRNNGDLVAVWREAPFHNVSTGADRGTIHQSVSTDDGATWGAPSVLYTDTAGELDARDPTVFRTDDGTLVLAFFLHSGVGTLDGIRSYVLRSTDDGATWSAPIPVPTALTQWDVTANPPVQLADGTLVIAAYGRFNLGGGGKQSVTVSRSTDDGATWSHLATVIDAEAEGNIRSYQEPALDVDPWTGDLLCVMRTDDAGFRTSRSTDDGATWSDVVALGIGNGRPCLGRITRGGLVMLYRTAAEMTMTTSWDHGVTWTTPVRFDNTDSQKSAYAQLVEVATDTLAVFYYMQQAEELADGRFAYLTYPPATPPALGT